MSLALVLVCDLLLPSVHTELAACAGPRSNPVAQPCTKPESFPKITHSVGQKDRWTHTVPGAETVCQRRSHAGLGGEDNAARLEEEKLASAGAAAACCPEQARGEEGSSEMVRGRSEDSVRAGPGRPRSEHCPGAPGWAR